MYVLCVLSGWRRARLLPVDRVSMVASLHGNVLCPVGGDVLSMVTELLGYCEELEDSPDSS